MFKRLVILLYLLCIPAYAGIYDEALKGNKNVLLYLYTSDCRACRSFVNVYDELAKTNKDFKFVKVDAETKEGLSLMRKFRGYYVPYIVLTNPQSKKSAVIKPYCSMDSLCLERALKNFKG